MKTFQLQHTRPHGGGLHPVRVRLLLLVPAVDRLVPGALSLRLRRPAAIEVLSVPLIVAVLKGVFLGQLVSPFLSVFAQLNIAKRSEIIDPEVLTFLYLLPFCHVSMEELHVWPGKCYAHLALVLQTSFLSFLHLHLQRRRSLPLSP